VSNRLSISERVASLILRQRKRQSECAAYAKTASRCGTEANQMQEAVIIDCFALRRQSPSRRAAQHTSDETVRLSCAMPKVPASRAAISEDRDFDADAGGGIPVHMGGSWAEGGACRYGTAHINRFCIGPTVRSR